MQTFPHRSEFKDIYDVQHFIKELERDVHIVEELPLSLRKVEPISKAPVSWSKVWSLVSYSRFMVKMFCGASLP